MSAGQHDNRTPSAGAPDVDTLVETVRKALMRSFDVRGSGVLHPNDIAILDALSGLAATARGLQEQVRDLEADPDRPTVVYAGDELEAAEADRDRLDRRVAELKAALREIETEEGYGENPAPVIVQRVREIARAALAGDGGGA